MIDATIQDMEQQLTAAERTGDLAALRRLLAPDFHGVNMQGEKVDKAAFIAALTRPGLRFESLSIQDLDIHVSPPHASVIGESRFKGNLGSHSFEGTARFMDIWRCESSVWVLIASSVTPQKTPGG